MLLKLVKFAFFINVLNSVMVLYVKHMIHEVLFRNNKMYFLFYICIM